MDYQLVYNPLNVKENTEDHNSIESPCHHRPELQFFCQARYFYNRLIFSTISIRKQIVIIPHRIRTGEDSYDFTVMDDGHSADIMLDHEPHRFKRTFF